jgi:hypothetical protein
MPGGVTATVDRQDYSVHEAGVVAGEVGDGRRDLLRRGGPAGRRLKAEAGYSHERATADEAKRAGRAAEALVEAARRAHAG